MLLLLTILATVIAYTFRPTIVIDIGDYYDSAFLDRFHAREVDGIRDPETWIWPADQPELVITGKRHGDWLVVVHAAEHLPNRPLAGAGLAVNGVPVALPGKGDRFFTAFIPADLAASEQLILRLKPLLSGGPEPDIGVAGHITLSPARTYRWSRGCDDFPCSNPATIQLPRLGHGAWKVDLDMVAIHPGGQSPNAHLLVNGNTLAMLPDTSTLRRVSLLVPSHLTSSGDLELALVSDSYRDPRPLGILLARVAVSPIDSSAIFPPWTTLLAALVAMGGIYLNLVFILQPVLRTSATTSWPVSPLVLRWLVLGFCIAILVLGTWAMIIWRFPASFMLPGFAFLMLWSLLLIAVLRPLVAHAAGVDAATPVISVLLLIFIISYWIKAGGMLYPYFIGIDVHWHMERVRWILNGQLPLLYGTDSPLNESTMPEAEWGAERPVIPYSPFFHMFATVFVFLPWSLEFSANMFGAFLDSTTLLLIAILVIRSGFGARAAWLAALLYAVLPVNFLLHSWGNLPTTTGLWWTFATTVMLVIQWDQLAHRWSFLSFVVVILASLLFYTVAGFFLGLFFVLFTMALLVVHGIQRQGGSLIREIGRLWAAIGVALVLSLILYYGQYVEPIITQTLPYFGTALTQSHEETGRVGDTIGDYLIRHTRLIGYGLVLPIVLSGIYLMWEWHDRHQIRGTGRARLWAAVAGWYGVMLLFVPLAYKISMVDKHFFVALPVLVIGSAVMIDRLWQRGWPMIVAIIVYYGMLVSSALQLWISRIANVQQ